MCRGSVAKSLKVELREYSGLLSHTSTRVLYYVTMSRSSMLSHFLLKEFLALAMFYCSGILNDQEFSYSCPLSCPSFRIKMTLTAPRCLSCFDALSLSFRASLGYVHVLAFSSSIKRDSITAIFDEQASTQVQFSSAGYVRAFYLFLASKLY
jgi:hypothetical protein